MGASTPSERHGCSKHSRAQSVDYQALRRHRVGARDLEPAGALDGWRDRCGGARGRRQHVLVHSTANDVEVSTVSAAAAALTATTATRAVRATRLICRLSSLSHAAPALLRAFARNAPHRGSANKGIIVPPAGTRRADTPPRIRALWVRRRRTPGSGNRLSTPRKPRGGAAAMIAPALVRRSRTRGRPLSNPSPRRRG
jgi:hypothetical protein